MYSIEDFLTSEKFNVLSYFELKQAIVQKKMEYLKCLIVYISRYLFLIT